MKKLDVDRSHGFQIVLFRKIIGSSDSKRAYEVLTKKLILPYVQPHHLVLPLIVHQRSLQPSKEIFYNVHLLIIQGSRKINVPMSLPPLPPPPPTGPKHLLHKHPLKQL